MERPDDLPTWEIVYQETADSEPVKVYVEARTVGWAVSKALRDKQLSGETTDSVNITIRKVCIGTVS